MEVNERFDHLLINITLTDAQKADGATKRQSVCSVLNRRYYNSESGTSNSIYVGSWGKGTRTRPPRDVDVLFELPLSVYQRLQARNGNKQSQLLQEVKTTLAASFSRTDIRGDGPVVMVPFQSYAVELLPAFRLTNGRYWIPITAKGGYYKEFDPKAEQDKIAASNTQRNNNTRDLIRMVKCWQKSVLCQLSRFISNYWLSIFWMRGRMQENQRCFMIGW